jgi:hypothetical protein
VAGSTFRAGIKPRWLHRALELLAWLSERLRLPPDLLARPSAIVLDIVSRSGAVSNSDGRMIVQVSVPDSGDPSADVLGTWELVAKPGVGPILPGIPAVVVAERIASGAVPGGPQSAAELVSVAELEEMYAAIPGGGVSTHFASGPGARRLIPAADHHHHHHHHSCGQQITAPSSSPILAALSPADAALLPGPILAVHGSHSSGPLFGTSHVSGGGGPIGALIRAVAALAPPSNRPVRIAFQRFPARADHGGIESWVRQFGDHEFATVIQSPGGDVDSSRRGEFDEVVGPIAIAFRPTLLRQGEMGQQGRTGEIDGTDDCDRRGARGGPVTGIEWVPQAARVALLGRVLPIRIPLALCPRIKAHEQSLGAADYSFHVRISFPVLGTVAEYRGSLEIH